MTIDVSVILVNYNTAGLTVTCLESIFEHTTGLNFEVIVVDNGSNDNSAEIIRKRFPQVLVMQLFHNIGFGRACNLGANQADGQYLLMLNTDTILLNNAVKVLFDFYESHQAENVGVIGGVLLNPDYTNGWSCNSFNSLSSIITWYYCRLCDTHRKSVNLVSNVHLERNEFIEVDFVTGADMFIKKDLFIEVLGFDPNIFLYYEDELLQWHLKKIGKRNLIVGGVKIVHLEGGSQERSNVKVSNTKRIISEKSMFYYFRVTRGSSYKNYAKIIYFFVVALPMRVMYSFSENKEYLRNYFKF